MEKRICLRGNLEKSIEILMEIPEKCVDNIVYNCFPSES